MLIVLFLDEGLAVNTTPANITAAILVFSLLAAGIWKGEQIVFTQVSKFNANSVNAGDITHPRRRLSHFLRSKFNYEEFWEKWRWNRKK